MDADHNHDNKDVLEEEIQRSKKQEERIVAKELGEINGLKWPFLDDAKMNAKFIQCQALRNVELRLKRSSPILNHFRLTRTHGTS